ncbi:hypothetical protein Dimus_001322, partial [Dionaea muscipula]
GSLASRHRRFTPVRRQDVARWHSSASWCCQRRSEVERREAATNKSKPPVNKGRRGDGMCAGYGGSTPIG